MRAAALPFLVITLLGALPAAASAEDYPAKAVRIITAPAGTFHDIVTRQLAQRLSERWRQAVVVENRAGAGLVVGTGAAASAAADGYTLLMSDRTALAVAPSLQKGLSYDPVRDFAPISFVAVAPLVLVAHPSLAPRTLREFIDHAARQPGGIAFAAGGPGTASHVAQALLERMTGIKVLTVQYKGGGQAIVALVAAEASAGFSTIPVALPHVRSGRLRAYAIASPERFAGAPEVPTFAEAGLPGFEAGLWIGMLAPAKTPAGVVAKLNRDIVQILREPTLQVALLAQGAQPAPGTPAEFAQLIKSELQKMKELVEATGLRAD